MTGIRWISSLDVHPLGEHLIVGGYDKKLCWFDLELGDKPYKVLRYDLLSCFRLKRAHAFSGIIQGLYAPCSFILHTRFLHHLRMMGLFKSFMEGCTTIP